MTQLDDWFGFFEKGKEKWKTEMEMTLALMGMCRTLRWSSVGVFREFLSRGAKVVWTFV